MDFQDLLAQSGGFRGKIGKGGVMLTRNELVLTFVDCYVSATFGEN